MDDDDLLRKYIGTESGRHSEYYVRCADERGPHEREIWYLVAFCLGQPKDEALAELTESYGMSAGEATAAWLFVNRYPHTAIALRNGHLEPLQYHWRIPEGLTQSADPTQELELTA